MTKAEKAAFTVLLSNLDSIMLRYEDRMHSTNLPDF